MSIVDVCVLLVCSGVVGHVWHAADRTEQTGLRALPGRCSLDLSMRHAGVGVRLHDTTLSRRRLTERQVAPIACAFLAFVAGHEARGRAVGATHRCPVGGRHPDDSCPRPTGVAVATRGRRLRAAISGSRQAAGAPCSLSSLPVSGLSWWWPAVGCGRRRAPSPPGVVKAGGVFGTARACWCWSR
jgi:hypothetical protein